jgi:hypothetical protein
MITLLSTTYSYAQDEKIIVAIDENYSPYMYVYEKKIKGLYPKQIEAVFSRIINSVEIQALP